MKSYAVLGLLALLAFGALADNNEVNSQSGGTSPKTTQAVANTKSSSDSTSNWPSFVNGYGTAVAAGGVVVVGVVVLLAIAAVISPLFGYKLCQLFSTCEGSPSSAMAYSLDAANQGTFPAPYGNAVYKKRSVNENAVGPILQILTSAYQKYGNAMQQPLYPVYDAAKNTKE